MYGSVIALKKLIWCNALASEICFWNALKFILFLNDWWLVAKSGLTVTLLRKRSWAMQDETAQTTLLCYWLLWEHFIFFYNHWTKTIGLFCFCPLFNKYFVKLFLNGNSSCKCHIKFKEYFVLLDSSFNNSINMKYIDKLFADITF